MNVEALKARLAHEEGFRSKPYRDSVGKLTIGYGRNLDDRGITQQEAAFMLDRDLAIVSTQLYVNVPWFTKLNDVRQRVLADMCFNMGIGGLLGFHQALAAAERGDYETAAREMLESRWARQVGLRAQQLAAMMRTGIDPDATPVI